MKKKIIISIVIIIGIIMIVFLVNLIRITKGFELDKEGKYKVIESGLYSAVEGGLGSSTHYYEIDLEEGYIDYRYDTELYDIEINSKLDKFLHNKKRKLIQKYKINDNQVEKLKELFEKNKNNELPNDLQGFFDMPNSYYTVLTKDNLFGITEREDIKEFRNIIGSIGD